MSLSLPLKKISEEAKKETCLWLYLYEIFAKLFVVFLENIIHFFIPFNELVFSTFYGNSNFFLRRQSFFLQNGNFSIYCFTSYLQTIKSLIARHLFESLNCILLFIIVFYLSLEYIALIIASWYITLYATVSSFVGL